jgi:hypothetical protein
MPVQMQYTAVAERTLRVPYRCAKCGTTSTAIVPVKAAGYATSPGIADNPEARQRAANQAIEGTKKYATLQASIARCPRCGGHDEAARTAFKKKITSATVIGGVATVIGFVLIGVASSAGVWAGIIGGILVIGGLTAAITAPVSYRSTIQKADTLQFEAEPAR